MNAFLLVAGIAAERVSAKYRVDAEAVPAKPSTAHLLDLATSVAFGALAAFGAYLVLI